MILIQMRNHLRHASFLNGWMFTSFLGALIATLGLVYIQDNLGWCIYPYSWIIIVPSYILYRDTNI
ncbi:hypothetical protein Lalb_Chr11g0075181 [Lupinus albus]|uniref:Uncharacterized protein n=1 Tax=Lupinus albus TaxID=3870 RepID=A0A6A4PTK2_LUPAL|nr:hypothetical protein Lalb_Chr11g0075181 [Lupinus albus]